MQKSPFNSLSVFLLALIMLCSPAKAADPSWQLVWSDEFSGDGLPVSNKWGQEHGMIRNGEDQFYLSNRLDACEQRNGHLILHAQKQNVYDQSGSTTPPNAPLSNTTRDDKTLATGTRKSSTNVTPIANYTSCSVFSKQAWTYGRFEIRAKLPSGQGIWPALWLRNNVPGQTPPTPAYLEIDIMEYIGDRERNKHFSTLHWGPNYQPPMQFDSRTFVDPNMENDFHLYVLEWTHDYIKIWVDGRLVTNFDVNAINTGHNLQYFRMPMFLRMNFALGGNWAGPVGPDTLPETFEVDYVRVYQKAGSSISQSNGIRDKNDIPVKENDVPVNEVVTSESPAAVTVDTKGLKSSKMSKCAPYGRNFEARQIEYQGKKIWRCFRKGT